MDIAKLFDELKTNAISVSLKDEEKLNISFDGEMPSHLLDALKDQKKEIIEILKGQKKIPIAKIKKQEYYELSDHQRRIWILSQLYEGGSSAYNIYKAQTFSGEFDIPSLRLAFDKLVERHEILRTVFREGPDGKPYQYVRDFYEEVYEIEIHDLKHEPVEVINDTLHAFIAENSLKVFDLENGPLLRVHLFETGKKELVAYINLHHIVSDAWSLGVLFNDIQLIYQSIVSDSPNTLEPLRIQYKDFANHQLKQLESEQMQNIRNYWIGQFENGVPNFNLPFSKKRPVTKTFAGIRLEYNFTKEVTLVLKNFCKSHHKTLFSTLLAAINSLFYRYSGESDIVVGSPITERKDAELENQIGFYGNTLVLRTTFEGKDTFLDMCEKTNSTVTAATENSSYPFIRLVDDLKIKRDSSKNPLVNILFALQNELGSSTVSSVKEEDVDRIIDRGKVLTRLDIDFSFEEFGNHLNMLIEFNDSLYDQEFIESFVLNFRNFLTNALANPTQEIDKIDFMTTEEVDRIKMYSEGKQTSINLEKSVIENFDTQCKKSGDSIAIVDGSLALTYSELDDKSNQLAHFLQSERNIVAGNKIILQLEKSAWHVVAQLAILKLRSVFIPIHCNFSEKKLRTIQETNNIETRVDKAVIEKFLKTDQSKWPTAPILMNIMGSDLAYVMYTSGTTGNPKGVMISHKNINHLALEGEFCPINSNTIILSTASFSFDAATFEVYATLLNGGRLVIVDEKKILDETELTKVVKEHQINTMWLTGSWMNQLIDMNSLVFQDLSLVVCGGEALDANRIKILKALNPSLLIVNGYGPTENCTFSVTSKCNTIDFDNNVPIGSPLNNSSAFIFDEAMNLLPLGGKGEICLGGAGLSSGYLGNDLLTKEKFIDHPIHEGEKIYRSGDIGKFRKDGLIEYLGRKDRQYKIRGFRVELEEIEEAIADQPGVDNVVVLVNEYNNQEIVAFVTTSSCVVMTSNILEKVGDLIPEYMIPNRLIKVDKIPLTKNGKIDRECLLKQVEDVNDTNKVVAPEGDNEEFILKIWQEVLGVEKISVNSNFFEIGGNSILLIDLASRLSTYFHVTYSSLGRYIKNFTIRELAANLIRLESNTI